MQKTKQSVEMQVEEVVRTNTNTRARAHTHTQSTKHKAQSRQSTKHTQHTQQQHTKTTRKKQKQNDGRCDGFSRVTEIRVREKGQAGVGSRKSDSESVWHVSATKLERGAESRERESLEKE